MKKKIPILWELLLHFAKIGCFTFGGGYAMIGLIFRHLRQPEEMDR